MAERRVGCVLVTSPAGKIVGILTEQDIVRKVVAAGANAANVTVADVMTRNVVACTGETEIVKAQKIMAERGIRHLPVIDGGKLKGMISSRDIMRRQLQQANETIRRQRELLEGAERQNPELFHLRRDKSGRIVI